MKKLYQCGLLLIFFSVPLWAQGSLQKAGKSKKPSLINALKTERENEELYQNFVTNNRAFTYNIKKSNTYDTNLRGVVTDLITAILQKKDFFVMEKKHSEFLNNAAEHYFYHYNDSDNKLKAFQLWKQIIRLDLQNLAIHSGKDYTNYKSDLNKTALNNAFEMDRYWYEVYHLKKKFPKNKNFSKTYKTYSDYYWKGLNYSKALNINLVTYYLSIPDSEKAKRILARDSLYKNDYYWQRIKYLNFRSETNAYRKFDKFRNYLDSLMMSDDVQQVLEDKYYNAANNILFKYGLQKEKGQGFYDIDLNYPETLTKVLGLYRKAISRNPDSYAYNFNQGMLYARLKKYVKA